MLQIMDHATNYGSCYKYMKRQDFDVHAAYHRYSTTLN